MGAKNRNRILMGLLFFIGSLVGYALISLVGYALIAIPLCGGCHIMRDASADYKGIKNGLCTGCQRITFRDLSCGISMGCGAGEGVNN